MKYVIICLTILFIACATVTKYIMVRTNPPGALIEVDGMSVGRAPTIFWIKGSKESTKLYAIRAIPFDISNEIIFVKKLMALRETVGTNDLIVEYIKRFGEPQNVNMEVIEHVFSYLTMNKGEATVDELLSAYIDTFSPQYTQSNFLWWNEICAWQQDTLFMYFDMTSREVPKKYEIELK